MPLCRLCPCTHQCVEQIVFGKSMRFVNMECMATAGDVEMTSACELDVVIYLAAPHCNAAELAPFLPQPFFAACTLKRKPPDSFFRNNAYHKTTFLLISLACRLLACKSRAPRTPRIFRSWEGMRTWCTRGSKQPALYRSGR